jgi:hypothetical protein
VFYPREPAAENMSEVSKFYVRLDEILTISVGWEVFGRIMGLGLNEKILLAFISVH